MRKQILSLVALVCTAGAYAQTLNIVEGDITYTYAGDKMGKAVFNENGTFTIMGREFTPSSIDRMFADLSEVTDNLVTVNYSDNSASVNISGNVAQYVTVTTDGAHVSITQSDAVNEEIGEITYRLAGSSTNGSFSLTGSYKSTVELNGLTLTNPNGAVLDIQNGKRIGLKVESGTVNTLADGAGGKQKGAIVCKGHLEIKGKGELNVTGNTAHAIQSKEYFEMKNATLNILGSVKDGINCTQYFLLESGKLTLSNIGDDAVQTDFKDATDREAEDTGSITIKGGSFKATVTAIAVKGLKAEGDVVVSGGEIEFKATGKGMWDSSKNKTKASACISADGDVLISGGTLELTATGSGGKGISCDGTTTVKDGTLNITTSGGVFAYVNGIEYDGYTGNTDRLNSEYKSSAKGIKSDTSVVIDGGEFVVRTSGKGAEGIESKGTLTINGGKVFVKAYDDGINSSSHMYINGGDIIAIATNNDGLDSNGNLYFNGGTVRAFGGSSPECGIDANDEQGYSVIFKGGYVLAVGGGNSVPSSSESTQPYVSGSSTTKANNEVTIKSGDEVLATFTVPAEYGTSTTTNPWGAPGVAGAPGGMSGKGFLISCPGLISGQSYTIQNGTTTTTMTATLKGSGSTRPW